MWMKEQPGAGCPTAEGQQAHPRASRSMWAAISLTWSDWSSRRLHSTWAVFVRLVLLPGGRQQGPQPVRPLPPQPGRRELERRALVEFHELGDQLLAAHRGDLVAVA
jgi:hypothetical protein